MTFVKGHQTNVGRKHSEETKRKIGIAHKGKIYNEFTREKIRNARLGSKMPEKTRLAIYRANLGNAYAKGKRHKLSTETRIKMSLNNGQKGSTHWNWNGGITDSNRKIRHSLEYKFWREAVFKKDDWTCVICFKRGCKIQADHIKSFSKYPELRFDINNGRTLCFDCHKKTFTYGGKSRNI